MRHAKVNTARGGYEIKLEMEHTAHHSSTHMHKRAGFIRPLASHRPYGVTVAEVKGGNYLSEELPGFFGGQPAFLHQVVK